MSSTGSRIKAFRTRLKMSQEELAKLTGYTDRSTISKIEKGTIEINETGVNDFAKALGVTPAEILGLVDVTATEATVTFPVLADVAAGYDKDAFVDESLGTIEMPISWMKGRPQSDYFVLRVSGDSMYPQYQDGDLVLVKRQTTLDHSGQIGVVIYEDISATLKKVEYVYGEDWMRLVPINPAFPPILVEGEALEHCRVLGYPVKLMRDIR